MKTLALKASLLVTMFGFMLPTTAVCDDGETTVQDHAVEEHAAVEPIEHGTMPADHGSVAHDAHGYGVNTGVHDPEYAHHRYLQSHTAGHAEYTHRWNLYHAAQSPWHGPYYNSAWGRPLALVVPPTADNQVSWGWGVGATNVRPIYHQFGRGNPATYPQESWHQFRPTPYWPSHTDQFGVYYVRGPW